MEEGDELEEGGVAGAAEVEVSGVSTYPLLGPIRSNLQCFTSESFV